MSETLSHQPLAPPTSVDSTTAADDDVWLMITEILLNQGCSTKKTGKILKFDDWIFKILPFARSVGIFCYMIKDQDQDICDFFLSIEMLLSVSWLTEISRREKAGERNIWDQNVAEMFFFAILWKDNGAKVFRRTGYLEELDIWEGHYFTTLFINRKTLDFRVGLFLCWWAFKVGFYPRQLTQTLFCPSKYFIQTLLYPSKYLIQALF